MIIHGLLQSRRFAPKSAVAFFESSNLQSARQLFDQILQPDTVLWNVMFKGYAEAGLHRETLLPFSQMKRRDVHCFDLRTGLRSNLFVGTSLIERLARD
ncbi:pentatricopeptide repeat-containing protein At3g49710-like isoform X2 [Phalaenopsis equestris]|uniref:pentatricopeptide repeat-containing protein At3g49710-like isoform X2 n=1 Tax=Phalaenopsis equestris TaxID=78828 RepID=UPI0009E371F3|nr:pentatricopeptide repeat-containing protein At3g49710-like isoform X2 [Phalaenopsis equestris]